MDSKLNLAHQPSDGKLGDRTSETERGRNKEKS